MSRPLRNLTLALALSAAALPVFAGGDLNNALAVAWAASLAPRWAARWVVAPAP
jgi:hypothetical protein